MKVKTIRDIELSGKRVLVRVDFNVPFDSTGHISDNTRIVAALPTIQYLLEQKATIILMSHLGRPKGQVVEKFSLKPVAQELQKQLGKPVQMANDCIGEGVQKMINAAEPGSIILLENLRFHKEEEENNPLFSKALASLADAYVNDAFGAAHRAHASTAGVADYLSEKASGFLMEKELDFLGEKTKNPEHPFVVILGGAKVSDKINVINALLDKADSMLIGGAMAYTFAMAQGKLVGDSLVEKDKISIAKAAIEKAKKNGVKLLLPLDNLVTNELDFNNGRVGDTQVVTEINEGWQGVDIGPKTIQIFKDEISAAKTILWNGPMGVFEIQNCAKGTFAIAEAVAHSHATSIIGGGDSVKAIKQSGYGDQVSFISTGGGASLEFLEGKVLPGVQSLSSHAQKV